jgi:hypothetical protein
MTDTGTQSVEMGVTPHHLPEPNIEQAARGEWVRSELERFTFTRPAYRLRVAPRWPDDRSTDLSSTYLAGDLDWAVLLEDRAVAVKYAVWTALHDMTLAGYTTEQRQRYVHNAVLYLVQRAAREGLMYDGGPLPV